MLLCVHSDGLFCTLSGVAWIATASVMDATVRIGQLQLLLQSSDPCLMAVARLFPCMLISHLLLTDLCREYWFAFSRFEGDKWVISRLAEERNGIRTLFMQAGVYKLANVVKMIKFFG